jgi:hypothetical protein
VILSDQDDLRSSVERAFDCKAMFLKSEILFVHGVEDSIREVATFAISHPSATKAFAWKDVSKTAVRHRVVLQQHGVTTPLLALEQFFDRFADGQATG